MTPEQFCYWMQGFSELNTAPPTPEQWQSIREHLALVFNKVTPPVAMPVPTGGGGFVPTGTPIPAQLVDGLARDISPHYRPRTFC